MSYQQTNLETRIKSQEKPKRPHKDDELSKNQLVSDRLYNLHQANIASHQTIEFKQQKVSIPTQKKPLNASQIDQINTQGGMIGGALIQTQHPMSTQSRHNIDKPQALISSSTNSKAMLSNLGRNATTTVNNSREGVNIQKGMNTVSQSAIFPKGAVNLVSQNSNFSSLMQKQMTAKTHDQVKHPTSKQQNVQNADKYPAISQRKNDELNYVGRYQDVTLQSQYQHMTLSSSVDGGGSSHSSQNQHLFPHSNIKNTRGSQPAQKQKLKNFKRTVDKQQPLQIQGTNSIQIASRGISNIIQSQQQASDDRKKAFSGDGTKLSTKSRNLTEKSVVGSSSFTKSSLTKISIRDQNSNRQLQRPPSSHNTGSHYMDRVTGTSGSMLSQQTGMVINRSGSNPVGGVSSKNKITNFRADRLNINNSVQPDASQVESLNRIKATVAVLGRDSHPTVIGQRDSKPSLGGPKAVQSIKSSSNDQIYRDGGRVHQSGSKKQRKSKASSIAGSNHSKVKSSDKSVASNSRGNCSASRSKSSSAEKSNFKTQNLNQSSGSKNQQPPSLKNINEQQQLIQNGNQVFLLPNHMIKPNGPSSMQAQSSKNNLQSQIQMHLQGNQNMLSSSFEKLSVKQDSSNGQSSDNKMRRSQQNQVQQTSELLGNFSNVIKADILRNSMNVISENTNNNHSSLKLKKSSNLANPNSHRQGKTFMTPQRIGKQKEINIKKTGLAASLEHANDNVANLSISMLASKQGIQKNKAHQYLRNSFLIKQPAQNNTQIQLQNQNSSTQYQKMLNSHTFMGNSISPRANVSLLSKHSANNYVQGQRIQKGMNPVVNNSYNLIQPASQGDLVQGGRTQSKKRQTATVSSKVGQQNSKLGRPKNLNIAGKKAAQANQEKAKKLMIDKKTYEDLMSYLVNAECNRLKQQQVPYSVTPVASNQPKQQFSSSSSQKMHAQETLMSRGQLTSATSENNKLTNIYKQQTFSQDSLKQANQECRFNNSAEKQSRISLNNSSHSTYNHPGKLKSNSQTPTNKGQSNSFKQKQFSNFVPIQGANQPRSGSSQNRDTSVGSHKVVSKFKQGVVGAQINPNVNETVVIPASKVIHAQNANSLKQVQTQKQQGKGSFIIYKQGNQMKTRNIGNIQQNLKSHNITMKQQSNPIGTMIPASGNLLNVSQTTSKSNQLLKVSLQGNKDLQKSGSLNTRQGANSHLKIKQNSRNQPQPPQAMTQTSNFTTPQNTTQGVPINPSHQSIPTKVIKANKFVRANGPAGKQGQAPKLFSVKDAQANITKPSQQPLLQLKNNFVSLKDNQIDQLNQVQSLSRGLKQLQVKQIAIPVVQDRIQSAKSSATNGNTSASQIKQLLYQDNQADQLKNVNNIMTVGALSQRESQRYYSRPDAGMSSQNDQVKSNQAHQTNAEVHDRLSNSEPKVQSANSQKQRQSSKYSQVARDVSHLSQRMSQRPMGGNKSQSRGASGSKVSGLDQQQWYQNSGQSAVTRKDKKTKRSGSMSSNRSKRNGHSNNVHTRSSSKRRQKEDHLASRQSAGKGKKGKNCVAKQNVVQNIGIQSSYPKSRPPTQAKGRDSSLKMQDQIVQQQQVLKKTYQIERQNVDEVNYRASGKTKLTHEIDQDSDEMAGSNFNTFGERGPNMFYHQDQESKLKSSINQYESSQVVKVHRPANNDSSKIESSEDLDLNIRLDMKNLQVRENFLINNNVSSQPSDMKSEHVLNEQLINQAHKVTDAPLNTILDGTIQSQKQLPKNPKTSKKLIRVNEKEAVARTIEHSPRRVNSIASSRDRQATQQIHYSGSFGMPDSSILGKEGSGESQKMKIESKSPNIKLSKFDGEGSSKENTWKQFNDFVDGEEEAKRGKTNEESLLKKSEFQLINMSFSQEGIDAKNSMQQIKGIKGGIDVHIQKNPHNTLIQDSMLTNDIMDSYQVHENTLKSQNTTLLVSSGQIDLKRDVEVIRFDSEQTNDDIIEKEVAEKIYSDKEYRKQLLLRVLPKFDKLEQFDQLHEEMEDRDNKDMVAVSKGAASLIKQINFSLGRSADMSAKPEQTVDVQIEGEDSNVIDNSESQALVLNSFEADNSTIDIGDSVTLVENECDDDFQYLIQSTDNTGLKTPATPISCLHIKSPNDSSTQNHLKSFEETIQSPSTANHINSTCMILQTPQGGVSPYLDQNGLATSNNTSTSACVIQSRRDTNVLVDDHAQEEKIGNHVLSSDQSGERKGAFAVFSPRTAAKAAAIYEDGANGGNKVPSTGLQAGRSSMSSREEENIQDSLQGKRLTDVNPGVGEQSQPYGNHFQSQIRHSLTEDNLPQYGLQRIIRDDGDEEEEEDDLMDQSFQTMRADNEEQASYYQFDQAEKEKYEASKAQEGNVTSLYGPEKPEYEEMMSLMQPESDETTSGQPIQLLDEQILLQLRTADQDDDIDDTDGGDQAKIGSPKSSDIEHELLKHKSV